MIVYIFYQALTYQSNYSAGGTNISAALDVMRTQIFNVANGDRPDVIDIGILMTDGVSTGNGDRTAKQAAKDAKDANIKLITIGITDDIDPYELNDIASEPKKDHMFEAETFKQLEPMLDGLLYRVCGAPPVTTSTQSSTSATSTQSPGENIFWASYRFLNKTRLPIRIKLLKRNCINFGSSYIYNLLDGLHIM